ncbi:MAG: hypothetical protein J6J12_08015 [Oscillospiraceae bacterium]|nr:hypothetical protein [Oscillospiraceae bacterium]
MKRITALLLALALCLALTACGGPDRQPAIDAYNEVTENYNKFVDIGNAHIEEFTDEDIEVLNACAEALTQYGEQLESDEELTQEQLDEMVAMFEEFNGIILEFLAELEA